MSYPTVFCISHVRISCTACLLNLFSLLSIPLLHWTIFDSFSARLFFIDGLEYYLKYLLHTCKLLLLLLSYNINVSIFFFNGSLERNIEIGQWQQELEQVVGSIWAEGQRPLQAYHPRTDIFGVLQATFVQRDRVRRGDGYTAGPTNQERGLEFHVNHQPCSETAHWNERRATDDRHGGRIDRGLSIGPAEQRDSIQTEIVRVSWNWQPGIVWEYVQKSGRSGHPKGKSRMTIFDFIQNTKLTGLEWNNFTFNFSISSYL